MATSRSKVCGIVPKSTLESSTSLQDFDSGVIFDSNTQTDFFMKTVIVVDDHELILEAVSARLRKLYTVYTSKTADQASTAIRKYQIDVALIDLSLPGRSGFDLAEELRIGAPACRLIALSMHHEVDYIIHAFDAGMRGFVSKDSPGSTIEYAIECVLSNKFFIDNNVAFQVVDLLRQRHPVKPEIVTHGQAALSPRELEVLVLIVQGNAPDRVAERLHISKHTAEMHQTNIYRKLGFNREAELVHYAIERGLIGPSGK